MSKGNAPENSSNNVSEFERLKSIITKNSNDIVKLKAELDASGININITAEDDEEQGFGYGNIQKETVLSALIEEGNPIISDKQVIHLLLEKGINITPRTLYFMKKNVQ